MALNEYKSTFIADCGISMGDEGKGRLISEIIEELREKTGSASPVQVVLKVNGGANSGHTAGGLKLNLLPAGVVDQSVETLAIGAGVVADPRKFRWELLPVDAKSYHVTERLLIDERTMVSDLSHRLLDLAWEWYRVNIIGEEPRGSTGRGITPSYQDEVGQFQIFYSDFLAPKEIFARKLSQKAQRACRVIQHVCQVTPEVWDSFFDTLTQAELRANEEALKEGIFSQDEFDFSVFKGSEPFALNIEKLIEVYWETGQQLAGRIGDVREVIREAQASGRYTIGEYGQAYWLDKRQGFSPNVSASHTYAPEFFNSACQPVQPLHVFGVGKAYDTKVGTHVFITEGEQDHPLFQRLRKLEFGVSTGRQRMVGWYDAVEKGDTLRYGGFDDLMINKIDALTQGDDWAGNLKICIAYEDQDGKRYYRVPRSETLRKSLKPVYQEYAGWKEDISKARSFADLPENAQAYIAGMMRSLLDSAYHGGEWPEQLPNLRYVGVGPMPSQIIRDIPQTRELLALDKPLD
ncbi:adenylosuccinate synthetase [Pelagicoccus sp. SDUM812003]|uniref:adenylosuccinate synthetase n=1 Tax=Pelagicoccus sp. SDUM812003 TaxID=3041267 RepID=UPI00280D18A3|nr:adenylosuccinate synthetase [Pelagicoccus sp. SDUM812003]MDQ8203148.1 adenylosuccinate synthetase [Pelagicoccus sp. SDUM812003]